MNALVQAAPAALDSVVYQLAQALSAALAKPQAAERDFIFQTSMELCAHLLSGHQEVPAAKAPERIALSPWQERLAKEIMLGQMARGLSMAQLASECSLSRSHFSRAFKRSTGLAPRDWFLKARIERAKTLLSDEQLSISQISLECGFADQSHFTRVFTRAVGATPFTWRRSRRGLPAQPSVPQQAMPV